VAYDQGLALDPNDALAWTTKGEILNDLRRYEEALPYLEGALAMDAQVLDAWKAVALRALGREAEAQEAERRAKEVGG
jgi:tetratricopeptide (TPR) repeat protein